LTSALAASALAASEYSSFLSSFQSDCILLDPWAKSPRRVGIWQESADLQEAMTDLGGRDAQKRSMVYRLYASTIRLTSSVSA
jgi:hypothetical protein